MYTFKHQVNLRSCVCGRIQTSNIFISVKCCVKKETEIKISNTTGDKKRIGWCCNSKSYQVLMKFSRNATPSKDSFQIMLQSLWCTHVACFDLKIKTSISSTTQRSNKQHQLLHLTPTNLKDRGIEIIVKRNVYVLNWYTYQPSPSKENIRVSFKASPSPKSTNFS